MHAKGRVPAGIARVIMRFHRAPRRVFRYTKNGYPHTGGLVLHLRPGRNVILGVKVGMPNTKFRIGRMAVSFDCGRLNNIPDNSTCTHLVSSYVRNSPALFAQDSTIRTS